MQKSAILTEQKREGNLIKKYSVDMSTMYNIKTNSNIVMLWNTFYQWAVREILKLKDDKETWNIPISTEQYIGFFNREMQ